MAALAVAAPILGDAVSMINHPWSFSIAALRERLGLQGLSVLNDFVANALAIPHLAPGDVAKIGGGEPAAGASIGVLGPGSGLGVSGLVRSEGREAAVEGEGGHVTLAPANDRESAVLERLRARFGHVSAERALSGPGLVNLYQALCELAGEAAPALTPARDHGFAPPGSGPSRARNGDDVLRDARRGRWQSCADARRARRRLYRGRHRAETRTRAVRAAVPKAIRGEGAVTRLSRRDTDLSDLAANASAARHGGEIAARFRMASRERSCGDA